jgi:hypothetical protein
MPPFSYEGPTAIAGGVSPQRRFRFLLVREDYKPFLQAAGGTKYRCLVRKPPGVPFLWRDLGSCRSEEAPHLYWNDGETRLAAWVGGRPCFGYDLERDEEILLTWEAFRLPHPEDLSDLRERIKHLQAIGFSLVDFALSAVKHGTTAEIKAVLDAGRDVDRASENLPMLHFAICEGSLEKVRFLVGEGAAVCGPYPASETGALYRPGGLSLGATPLHSAALIEDPSIAQFLLDKGADINATDLDGNTPLHVAIKARGGNLPLVECLLAAGSSLEIKNNRGETPLDLIPKRTNSASSKTVPTSRGLRIMEIAEKLSTPK